MICRRSIVDTLTDCNENGTHACANMDDNHGKTLENLSHIRKPDPPRPTFKYRTCVTRFLTQSLRDTFCSKRPLPVAKTVKTTLIDPLACGEEAYCPLPRTSLSPLPWPSAFRASGCAPSDLAPATATLLLSFYVVISLFSVSVCFVLFISSHVVISVAAGQLR